MAPTDHCVPVIRSAADSELKLRPRERARIVRRISKLLAALHSCNGDDSTSGLAARESIKLKLREVAVPLWAAGIPDE